ncbi:hypothetical protein [Microbacterium suaedae]|uniref:hypothetical protein n=1 Tax=Microbacterium suaedae TaxID=2067813 RepID=UPI000DA12161|nr:hypothetical protein [Microbacterium suaedae]
MTGTTTPTPPAPEQQPAAQPTSQSTTTRSGTRALAITIGVLGGGALILSGIGVAFTTVGSTIATTLGSAGEAAVSAAGATDLVAQVDAGELEIEFGRTDEAVLEHSSDNGTWTIDREGDAISVRSPERDFGFDPFDWGARQTATLTLPESLEGIDLDIRVAAGSIVADGDFGDIAYGIDAGRIEIEGSAGALDARMTAGRSVIDLDSVATANVEVTAGSLEAEFSGTPPEGVTVTVTAGSVEMRLPDVPYDVRVDREAGNLTSTLAEDRASSRTVEGTVMAGNLRLIAD